MSIIRTIEELEDIYRAVPALASMVKEVDYLTAEYRQLIAASPFVALATAGPEGLDCSPRGDAKGFVRVIDDRTVVMPDRRGNNRIDSLRNIVRDPRVALLFLIPGSGTALRINGRAAISIDAELLKSFEVEGKTPRSAIIIGVKAAYFQCARAILRAGLWNQATPADLADLPTPGQILDTLSKSEIDAETYDSEWPLRARETLW